MKIPFYQKLIPRKIRLKLLKNRIINCLSERNLNDEEQEVLDFLKRNELNIFPYNFPKNYRASDVQIIKDERLNLYYTLWEGKKLFYKNGSQPDKAKAYFNGLMMEQDLQSPHRYLTASFDVKQNDVIVDVGAAEGNFSLSVVERAKMVYLFEMDKEWIKALEATFEPWANKVKIVQKYVSDLDDDNCIKLDTFFAKNEQVNFLKADVEGAEGLVIAGADQIISRQKDLRIAVCTYHRQEDALNLDNMLQKGGFATHFSDGYMLFHYGKTNVVKAPYLRKAVLRGVKTS